MEILMINQWVIKTIGLGIGLIASLLMRSAIKPLLRVDEQSLLEVGLSRSDLIECLSTPLTTDPAKFLAARSRKHGPTKAFSLADHEVVLPPPLRTPKLQPERIQQ
jgi:hypothetical protein